DGQDKVPDFIQALENQDLKNPGTVVQVHFRIGGKGLDSPDKVTLGAWPTLALRNQNPSCWDQYTLWEVPVFPIKQIKSLDANAPPDPRGVMYWNPKPIPPGESRTVGYGYGLGQVASGEQAHGRIGLSVGGTLVVDYTFTVTALISDAKPGEQVTLE